MCRSPTLIGGHASADPGPRHNFPVSPHRRAIAREENHRRISGTIGRFASDDPGFDPNIFCEGSTFDCRIDFHPHVNQDQVQPVPLRGFDAASVLALESEGHRIQEPIEPGAIQLLPWPDLHSSFDLSHISDDSTGIANAFDPQCSQRYIMPRLDADNDLRGYPEKGNSLRIEATSIGEGYTLRAPYSLPAREESALAMLEVEHPRSILKTP